MGIEDAKEQSKQALDMEVKKTEVINNIPDLLIKILSSEDLEANRLELLSIAKAIKLEATKVLEYMQEIRKKHTS